GERLFDLRGDRCLRIVRQSVILPLAEGELGLQEEIISGDKPAGDRRRDGLPDRRLVIVPPLVSGVDAAKYLLEGEFGQPPGFVADAGNDRGPAPATGPGRPKARSPRIRPP